MAFGRSRLCCSPCRKPPSIDSVEDELARDLGSVGGPYSGSTSPAPSYKPNLGPDLVPALIPVLVPTPTPTPVPTPTFAPVPTNKLFKKFMEAYLELNQGPRQLLAERKWTLKTKVPEVYYGKSIIDCYHFCQQCEDHFETAGATGFNWTFFAASFFCGNISVC